MYEIYRKDMEGKLKVELILHSEEELYHLIRKTNAYRFGRYHYVSMGEMVIRDEFGFFLGQPYKPNPNVTLSSWSTTCPILSAWSKTKAVMYRGNTIISPETIVGLYRVGEMNSLPFYHRKRRKYHTYMPGCKGRNTRYHRNPKTTNEISQNCLFRNEYRNENISGRIRDGKLHLPTAWDDLARASWDAKSWKHYRKKQYKA